MDNLIIDKDSFVNAVGVTSVTYVGFFGEFPRKNGNCFSIITDESKHLKVLNFNHENLIELLSKGVLAYPVKILPLDDKHCLISDHRIPKEWYGQEFCSICTPYELLPLQQKLNRVMDVDGGRVVEKRVILENGESFILRRGKEFMPSGMIFAPYAVKNTSKDKWWYGRPLRWLSSLFKKKEPKYNKPINSKFYSQIKLENSK